MSTKPKTTEELIYDTFVSSLLMGLKGTVDPKTGELIPPSPNMLNVARQFLKENAISANADKHADTAALLKEMSLNLPFNDGQQTDTLQWVKK